MVTRFYQEVMDLTDTDALEARVQALLTRPLHSLVDLQDWLNEEELFGKHVSEAFMGHAIDFYCQTDDEERKARHVHDQTVVMPMLAQQQFELDKKFINCPFIDQLDDAKYDLLRKARLARVELFREENIALMAKEQQLVTEYSATVGGLTGDWEGEPQPIPFLQAKLTHPDRTVREQAWRSIKSAYSPFCEKIDSIMDELVSVRHQMALNAGFSNYRDYSFRVKNREYSLAEVERLHAVTENIVIPVWAEIAEDRRRELGIDTLRPWDIGAESQQLTPFADVSELVADVGRMLARTDTAFATLLTTMNENGLLDLESRAGKMHGGFNAPLVLSGHSFIFGNAAGADWDVTVLVHELGHAYHFEASKEDAVLDEGLHRSEIAELFSHAMEVLVIDKLEEVYPEPAALRAAQSRRLRRIASMLFGPVASDLFQHWMYTHPEHTAQERRAMWRDIEKRYSQRPVDWEGLDFELGVDWMGTEHYFGYPFYMLEYTISMLGAINLWIMYKENPALAIANYKRAASAGYSLPIRAVYALAGVDFDFSDSAVDRLAHYLLTQWRAAQQA